ncbi:hypothetical protein [Membranihabitans maritimus]|uniref:hypothetical protein n=1 Tax=Membranihabitans maritimus TaxID=2904244 RepID=UPI001F3BA4F2|nr:hypothetical protein [Membranihabitans maritimus]
MNLIYRNLKILILLGITAIVNPYLYGQVSGKSFRAGSAKSIITPPIGTSINGGMQDRQVRYIHDETYARGMVLDDGDNQLAIVVSDLCMIYRETVDKAKERAHEFTGIPMKNIVMSANHTHSAGTACSVFQSDPDPEYLEFLRIKIADAVIRAYENRVPAKIGWGFGKESSLVFNRRWRMKPGTEIMNPFGTQDKVKMNPGVGNPNNLEPAGPIDPEIPVVSVVSLEGDPIAIFSNYSLHYVGGTGPGEISGDYYGIFSKKIEELIGVKKDGPSFVGFMSNGTSGDINNIDFSGEYLQAKGQYVQMNYVANKVASEVYKVYQNIEYKDWVPLHSTQEEMELGVRMPDKNDIERAESIVEKAAGPNMKTLEEIYARETLQLKEFPESVNLLLQAHRIGDLVIATIPCEVFVEIGLELKEKGPFEDMFTISLANGYNGYLPTPEHHALGGYETWRAKSSYLEVNASRKITDTLMEMMRKLKE